MGSHQSYFQFFFFFFFHTKRFWAWQKHAYPNLQNVILIKGHRKRAFKNSELSFFLCWVAFWEKGIPGWEAGFVSYGFY